VIKTTAKRLRELEREVRRLHSYDVPEFIALPIAAGSSKYISWLQASVTQVRR
jgi:periplasmic divalent cation tolerance protein